MGITKQSSNPQSVLLDVAGMKCGGCVSAVERTLMSQPNVANASVNLVARTAWLDLKDPEQSIDQILSALADHGFTAKPRSISLLEKTSSEEINFAKRWWQQWRQLVIAIFLLLILRKDGGNSGGN